MAIHFATGGEIDRIYNPEVDQLQRARPAPSSRYLEFMKGLGATGFSSCELDIRNSDNLLPDDLDNIAETVTEADEAALVTANYFQLAHIGRWIFDSEPSRISRRNSSIVITGSKKPVLGHEVSEAGFNIGVGAAVLEPSKPKSFVSVVQNGQVSSVDPRHETKDMLGFDQFLLVPGGGSVDFTTNGVDSVEPAHESIVPWYLHRVASVQKAIELGPSILKDSRDVTDEDIEIVVESVRNSTLGHALVTAGGVKLEEIRDEIAAGLTSVNDQERTIVLTSSDYQLRRAGLSDSPYRLGYAYAKLGLLEPGVYSVRPGSVEAAA